MTPPLIYLAGPHVFEADAARTRAELERICAFHGLAGLWPSDAEVHEGEDRPERARRIFEANVARLRTARGVLADLRPFRGLEPDSGTVFEVGAAYALGIPVAAYGVPFEDYVRRVASKLVVAPDEGGVLRDGAGMAVEDFGLPVNLMLACASVLKATPDEAAAELAKLLL